MKKYADNHEFYRDTFNEVVASDKLKERIAQMAENPPKKRGGIFKTVLIAAAIISFGIISAVGIDAITGGKLFDPMREYFKGDEVLGNAEMLTEMDEVFAPNINYIDDNLLIFASKRGVVVYDRAKNRVLQTIDLQALKCMYIDDGCDFGEPPIYLTHVMKDGDNLLIFNTEKITNLSRKPYGIGYKYSLKENNSKPIKITDNKELASCYDKWMKFAEGYSEAVHFYDFLQNNGYNGGEGMYSFFELKWSDKDGNICRSILTIDSNVYKLRTIIGSSKKPISGQLRLADENEFYEYRKYNKLPKFRYTGSDKILAVIIKEREKHETDDLDSGEVWIPAYKIFGTEEKGDEFLVYGSFWDFTYKRNGKLLSCYSGSAGSGCYHLKKSGKSYKVVSKDMTLDGEGYGESIERIFQGHEDYKKMVLEGENDLKDFLKMYIKEHNLDIEYYYDSGEVKSIFE